MSRQYLPLMPPDGEFLHLRRRLAKNNMIIVICQPTQVAARSSSEIKYTAGSNRIQEFIDHFFSYDTVGTFFIHDGVIIIRNLIIEENIFQWFSRHNGI